MTRVTLDLDALVGAGALTPAEAERLRGLAAPRRTLQVVLTLLVVFGALGVVAGVLALDPPLEVGLLLAGAALGGGAAIRWKDGWRDDWGLLMQALALMGALGVSAYLLIRFEGGVWAHLGALALTTGCAFGFRNGVLAAAPPLLLGALIGSGTAYWHASYGLIVREATITIAVFGGLAAALFWARPRLPEPHRLVVTVIARVSFFLANFGFWIGSLWGDYPGELWAADGDWQAAESWREAAVYVPELAFSLGWAAFLAAATVIGVRTGRRFLANTAIVFLAIHGYTQFFETLGAQPATLVFAGLSMIAAGAGVARFDRWHQARGG